jgi:hypothetical protein
VQQLVAAGGGEKSSHRWRGMDEVEVCGCAADPPGEAVGGGQVEATGKALDELFMVPGRCVRLMCIGFPGPQPPLRLA